MAEEKSEPLAVPPGASGRRPNWILLVPIAAMHLACLAVFSSWLFDWRSVLLTAVVVPLFGLGINMSYHRQLTHRSFRTPLWLEHALVGIALCCLQDTPVKWVASHRMHHAKADRRDDPHSPLVSFFWAHCGWLFVVNDDASPLECYQRYARDILDDPWYMRLARSNIGEWIYLAHAGAFFLAGAAYGWTSSGASIEALRLGTSFVVWAVILRTVITWHVAWAVNSVGHRFGYRSYDTADDSRNNLLVGFFSAGEGWHNNHHADPTSASNQRRWWEIDTIYYAIKALERLGLATDVVEPTRKKTA